MPETTARVASLQRTTKETEIRLDLVLDGVGKAAIHTGVGFLDHMLTLMTVHGFFDLEWGMFTDLGLVGEDTPVVAVVHDCQVVHEKLHPSPTDILVDHIATPSGLHSVDRRAKRPHGVIWDLLDPKLIEQTPPLQELRVIQGLAPAT